MEINISIIRSAKRFRSTTMRIVNRGEIELRAPQRISPMMILEFITHNTKFLAKSLAIPEQAILPKTLSTGADFYIFGKRYLLELVSSTKKTIVIDSDNKTVSIHKRGATISRRQLYDALTSSLEHYVTKRVAELAPQMSSIRYGNVRYKLVRSLWGSCTQKGNLTFNKRLIHYPAEVIDYVIIHELAHLQQHNHSRAFWEIVQKHFPNHKGARLLLKKRIYG